MKVLSKEELGTLLTEAGPYCISLYMPAFRAGKETEQNGIRFKNLVNRVERDLVETGLRHREVKEFLSPMLEYITNPTFWRNQSDGLAVFLSQNVFRHYRVPHTFPELAVVSDRFHIKPLLPLLTGDSRFYVLAMSQKGVRVLHGTRNTVDELHLRDVPGSLAEAMAYDFAEKNLSFHTTQGGNPGRSGRRDSVFHGTGAQDVDRKNEILRYFQMVDKGVRDLLNEGEPPPLVLAGLDHLTPIYREATRYPNLVAESIDVNPDALKVQELHQRAWTVMEPRLLKEREDAAARLQEQLSTHSPRATDNLKEILADAFNGRLDTLFVDLDSHRWGRWDPATGDIVPGDEGPGVDDLLDFAAAHTLANKGTVWGVSANDLPVGVPVAALRRY